MSDRIDVPSPEEVEIDEFEEVIQRLMEVLEHEGFDYTFEEGLFWSSLEIEGKIFPFFLHLSERSFVEIRVRLAGEPEYVLKGSYEASISRIQQAYYGRIFLIEEGLLFWGYEGIPVSTSSMHDALVRVFEEITASIQSFHTAFSAMEDEHTDEEVLEIVDACIELNAFKGSPQTLQ